jgi:hypothetical protein
VNDPYSINLDVRKPNLGLNEEKVKKAATAWVLDRLFYNNDRDAI